MQATIFKIGDQVRLCTTGVRISDGRVWTVMAEDTNQTRTIDPEPAYRLQAGKNVRYAYQSVIVPATLVENEEVERGEEEET